MGVEELGGCNGGGKLDLSQALPPKKKGGHLVGARPNTFQLWCVDQ